MKEFAKLDIPKNVSVIFDSVWRDLYLKAYKNSEIVNKTLKKTPLNFGEGNVIEGNTTKRNLVDEAEKAVISQLWEYLLPSNQLTPNLQPKVLETIENAVNKISTNLKKLDTEKDDYTAKQESRRYLEEYARDLETGRKPQAGKVK